MCVCVCVSVIFMVDYISAFVFPFRYLFLCSDMLLIAQVRELSTFLRLLYSYNKPFRL